MRSMPWSDALFSSCLIEVLGITNASQVIQLLKVWEEGESNAFRYWPVAIRSLFPKYEVPTFCSEVHSLPKRQPGTPDETCTLWKKRGPSKAAFGPCPNWQEFSKVLMQIKESMGQSFVPERGCTHFTRQPKRMWGRMLNSRANSSRYRCTYNMTEFESSSAAT